MRFNGIVGAGRVWRVRPICIVQRITEFQWTIESDGNENAEHRALVFGVALKGPANVTPYGMQSLPIRVTLTAKVQ